MSSELNKRNIVQKAQIVKNEDNEYPYNVRILNSIDGGKNFYYSGDGKFFETKEDVRQFITNFKIIEGLEYLKNNFVDDEKKIIYMFELSKREFLKCFSEIREQEYENTKEEILHFIRTRKELNKKLNENI